MFWIGLFAIILLLLIVRRLARIEHATYDPPTEEDERRRIVRVRTDMVIWLVILTAVFSAILSSLFF